MESVIHSAYFSDDISKKSNHYHDCHQIIFITNGDIEVTINGTKQKAGTGNILIFSRYENHSVDILSDTYERFVLRISPFAANEANRAYSLFLNRPSGFHNIFDISCKAPEFKNIFRKIVYEKEQNGELTDEMQQLLVSELLIMIYRTNPDFFTPFDEEKFDTVFNIQKRFENDCKQQYSLESLAKEYLISTSTLSHQFKIITGFSVFEYLTFCRIAAAKYYLSKTNLDIGKIVEQIGFSDNSNFSRTFKRNVGLTPSQFRNTYKK